MLTATITINTDEVIANTIFDEGMIEAGKDGLYAGGEEVLSYISEYPPISEANMVGPYPKRWYTRGIGPHWALKGGGFNFRKTSQIMADRWSIERRNDGSEVIVGNNATYAPFVHGADKQPLFHAKRGWRTDEQTVELMRPVVLEKVREFVKKYLETKGTK